MDVLGNADKDSLEWSASPEVLPLKSYQYAINDKT